MARSTASASDLSAHSADDAAGAEAASNTCWSSPRVTSTCGGRERAAGLGPHSELGSVGLLRLPGSRIRCFGWPEAVLVHHRRVTTSLTVAVVQPPCTACDVAGNAQQHADAVRRAQARVVVFPELSLTGYELDAPAVAPDEAAPRAHRRCLRQERRGRLGRRAGAGPRRAGVHRGAAGRRGGGARGIPQDLARHLPGVHPVSPVPTSRIGHAHPVPGRELGQPETAPQRR